jgi:hypothetical protein
MVMSDNSHYSIVKELLLLLSTRCRNFNVQASRLEGSSFDYLRLWKSQICDREALVEVRGFEPLTPALQTRCSAS